MNAVAVVSFGQRRWQLDTGQSLTIGRSRACQLKLPDDDHLSRHAGSLQVLDDCVMIRNESRSKPLVLRPQVGEDRVVEPGEATTSRPLAVFSLLFTGSGGCAVSIEVGVFVSYVTTATGAAPPAPITKAPRTVVSPFEPTPAQRRVLLALCEPLLTCAGSAARPATYQEIGSRLNRSPQYIRNVIKVLRDSLDGHGFADVAPQEEDGLHQDFRLATAHWAIRNGRVTVAALGELPARHTPEGQ